MSEEKNTIELLFSREVSEHGGIVTIINVTFVPEEAKAFVTLQTLNGPGGYSTTALLHPETCRILGRILTGVADEYERRVGAA